MSLAVQLKTMKIRNTTKNDNFNVTSLSTHNIIHELKSTLEEYPVKI